MHKKNQFRWFALVSCVVFLAVGCDATPDKTRAPSRPSESVARVTQPVVAAVRGSLLSAGPLGTDAVLGYRHEFVHSRFAMGAGAPVTVSDSTGSRHTGSEGVFVEWSNGFSMARPNGGAPSTTAPALTTNAEQHNSRVVAYFSTLGMPVDQMGAPQISTLMHRTGTTNGVELSNEFVRFTTNIPRYVDGVPIPDSHAWAEFNANDDVVAEQVWWPALPASLHAEIAAFRAMLNTPTAAAVFWTKTAALSQDDSGTLTIHHARPSGDVWYLTVSMDFGRRGRGAPVSVDISGNPLALSSDVVPAAGTAEPPSSFVPGSGLGNGTGGGNRQAGGR